MQASAFTSEQLGFGMPLTPEQLDKVNSWRASQLGPNPSDETKERYKPLTESPALRFLKYGKNRDGWWNYDQMAQQCTGIFQHLHHRIVHTHFSHRFNGRARSFIARRSVGGNFRLEHGPCEISL